MSRVFKEIIDKLIEKDELKIKKTYCLRDHRVVEHVYEEEFDSERGEWYRKFTCINCGYTMRYYDINKQVPI